MHDMMIRLVSWQLAEGRYALRELRAYYYDVNNLRYVIMLHVACRHGESTAYSKGYNGDDTRVIR
jgi:hypothetical protein